MDLGPFLSSFFAFLYEVAAMSAVFLIQMNQKPIFKIDRYMFQVNQMSLFRKHRLQQLEGSSDGGEGGRGSNLLL